MTYLSGESPCIGDHIRGTKKSNQAYSITNCSMYEAEVIQIKNGDITILILDHEDKTQVGKTFHVQSKYFELIRKKEQETAQPDAFHPAFDHPVTFQELLNY